MEMIPLTRKRLFEMVVMCLLSIGLAFVIVFALAQASHAREWGQAQSQYAAPDVQEYFKTLMQPDHPQTSCCGDADAYYADKADQDPDGSLVAIITDTRPDEWTREDGSKAYRPHVDVGTRIRVPPEKIRKHAIPNPTDHTLIFLSSGADYVFCYEPTGGI